LNIPTIKDPLDDRFEGLTVTTGATLGQLRRATKAFMQEAPSITEDRAIDLVARYSEKLFGKFTPSVNNRAQRRAAKKRKSF
jgi:hypothetical protein